jgi:SAM-dependent methyltransferase
VSDDLLAEQIAYYRERAAEYDETSYGDVDAAAARIERIVTDLDVSGSALELACGTGAWTRALAGQVTDLLAVDSSPEALGIARARCPATVRFEVVDLFAWEPPGRYDLVFFGFWISHVPTERVAAFFARLRSWLAPGGRVAFVDEPAWQSAKEPSTAGPETVRRALRDGSTHRLVKVYLDPDGLVARLAALGWAAEIRPDGDDWLVGQARPLT